jgi:hypothetical protein
VNFKFDHLIPTSTLWLRVLRVGLLFSAAGWGISFIFTFASWDAATDQLFLMGAHKIEYDPMLDYWLRMASAAFGCIGIASALACIRPTAFPGLIGILGPFHLFVGSTLVVAALKNQLKTELHPTFVADITFCFVTGTLIILSLCGSWFSRKG